MSIFSINGKKKEYVKKMLEKEIGKYGKIIYSYVVMNKRNIDEIMIISNLGNNIPETYIYNKYQAIDPVIIKALSRISPFVWDDSLKINSYWPMDKVFIAEEYDIQCGHSFVLHDTYNNMVLLTFYYDKYLMVDTGDSIKKNEADIQQLLTHTHEMLLEVGGKYKENKTTATELTPREAEVLYWSSTGKTYAEVAWILQVSISTVKFHIKGVTQKLGVKNAKHAISLAKELNLISSSPKLNESGR